MLRTPLWPVAPRDSRPVGRLKASQVLLLDDHELASGKLAALVARTASRDVFDAREMLRRGGLDRDKLRLGFVVYGGLNRVDWRAITLENVHTTAEDVDAQLAPMLREDIRPKKGSIEEWTKTLVRETRDLMSAVLPLAAREREFIDRLNERGEIAAELLTSDARLQPLLRGHPGLRWKAVNVRKHRALPPLDDTPAEDA